MGQWNMSVIGTGAHHNFKLDKEGRFITDEIGKAIRTYDGDADKLFEEFVQKLREMGHSVEHASFTHGARDYHN